MFEVISTIFWGLVLLTVIVFIHEAGHYLAARAFKVRVKEFMIGLPGPKIAFKRKGTYYGAAAIPLGGYCLIAGMEKGDEGDEVEKALAFITYFGKVSLEEADRATEVLGFDLVGGLDTLADWGTVRRTKSKGVYYYAIAEAIIDGVQYDEGQTRRIADPKVFLASERRQTYVSLPWWKRVVILLAGSATNLLVAIVVLIVLLMVNGSQVATTTVDTVIADSPAAQAGIVSGDQLVSVDGESFETWQDFTTAIQSAKVGTTIELGYLHDNTKKTVNITLTDNDGSPMVGVTSLIEREPISIFKAAELAVSLVGMTFTAILQLFNPATFAETIGQTSSVVGISIQASSAATSGPFAFVFLIAALSISIGFMNLLPIPPLDGGKIIIETVERISKRKVPIYIVNGISLLGFAALIALFIVATNADIHRYFLGG